MKLAIVTVMLAAGAGNALGQDGSPDAMSAETARLRIASALEVSGENLEALAEVAERAEDAHLRALAAYNAGTMAVALDDDRAEHLLGEADRAGDPSVRASARYNLGHAALPGADAPEDTPQAIDAKVEAYREAARRFRSVLDVDRRNLQAARNTELARRRIRELQDKKSRLEQQKQQTEDLAKQLQNLAQRQESQGAESQRSADQRRRPDPSAAQQQRSVSEETARAAESAEQAGADEGVKDSLAKAQEAQQQAQQALESGDAATAAAQQKQAAEALREAAERARSGAGGPGDQPRQPAEGDDGAENAEDATPQAAADEAEPQGERPGIDPVAEALLEKERRERAQRAPYLQRGGRPQVERDW